MQNKENHKTVLTRANAAIMNGDYEGFLTFCTDNTEWTFVGDKTIRGKEGVRQWMADTYLEPPKFVVENLIAEGDFVTAIGKIKMKGDEGNLENYAYCDVWRFVDGKMAGLTAFVIKIHA